MRTHNAVSLVAFVAFMSLPAAAQVVGDPCTDTDPETCSETGLILFCDPNTSTLAEFDCANVATGASCAVAPCVGDCTPFITCVAQRGSDCLGVSPIFDTDTSNDNQLMGAPCAAGSACQMTPDGETCVAPPGNISCTAAAIDQCVGDKLVICIAFQGGTSAVASPGVVDCAAFGLICGDLDGSPACIENVDPDCGSATGFGQCNGSVATSCSEGTVTGESDCANFGQVCIDDGGSPRCVLGDSACGPLGLGACSGTTATICSGAQVVTTTDCLDLGRRCGPIDASGQIGCVVFGGEGEGEGEPECSRDSDCNSNEECDAGECRRVRAPRGGDEPAAEPGLLAGLGCSSSGGAPLALALVGMLAVGRRRRR